MNLRKNESIDDVQLRGKRVSFVPTIMSPRRFTSDHRRHPYSFNSPDHQSRRRRRSQSYSLLAPRSA